MVKLILNISLIVPALFVFGCSGEQKTGINSAVSLFDGKSLDGWEGELNWFRVEDGAIVAGSLEKDIPQNLFLCTTREYGDFELKVEAKLIGPGDNSGIQFRSRRIAEDTEVSGYQADMGGPIGDFGVVWGSLYDESRRNKMLVTPNQKEIQKDYKLHEWNEMIVRCKGAHIQIWLNGHKTVDYTEDDNSIAKKGIIGFQIHAGAPAEAWFRNISLTEL